MKPQRLLADLTAAIAPIQALHQQAVETLAPTVAEILPPSITSWTMPAFRRGSPASSLSAATTGKGGTKLQPMVYNHDFVDRNFHQPAELKGIFTLGEKQLDTLAKTTTAKAELDTLTTKIETLTQGLQGVDGAGGKKGELATLEAGLKDKCWAQKQKHDAPRCLRGVSQQLRKVQSQSPPRTGLQHGRAQDTGRP